MKLITSRDNPRYKRLKALAGSTQQQRRGAQALLEGLHLALAYLDARGQPELCVVTDSALAHEETQAIVARIEPQRVVSLPDALFDQLSSVANGIGMLLLVERPAADLPKHVTRTAV
ncbi:MAG: RNA methyltransferase, partial [Burkholderia sp.]